MISILIVFCSAVTILLNVIFVHKIINKTYRICISAINFLFAFLFVMLFIILSITTTQISSIVDLQINNLENKVNEIYPGALEIQMDTTEIKKMLELSLEKRKGNGIEEIVSNILKSKIDGYASITLKTVNVLEKTDNKLSVKDAIFSIKQLTIESVAPYLKLVKIVLAVMYIVYIVGSILLSLYLAKNNKFESKSIIFGNEADDTSPGMKTDD